MQSINVTLMKGRILTLLAQEPLSKAQVRARCNPRRSAATFKTITLALRELKREKAIRDIGDNTLIVEKGETW